MTHSHRLPRTRRTCVLVAALLAFALALLLRVPPAEAGLVYGRITGPSAITGKEKVTLNFRKRGWDEAKPFTVKIARDRSYSVNLPEEGTYTVTIEVGGTTYRAVIRSAGKPLRQNMKLAGE